MFFEEVSYDINEDGISIPVCVRLNGGLERDVIVALSSENGNASGKNYDGDNY